MPFILLSALCLVRFYPEPPRRHLLLLHLYRSQDSRWGRWPDLSLFKNVTCGTQDFARPYYPRSFVRRHVSRTPAERKRGRGRRRGKKQKDKTKLWTQQTLDNQEGCFTLDLIKTSSSRPKTIICVSTFLCSCFFFFPFLSREIFLLWSWPFLFVASKQRKVSNSYFEQWLKSASDSGMTWKDSVLEQNTYS